MSLLTVGQGLRKNASDGMRAVADADVNSARQKIAMDKADRAAKMNTIGTAGGIGGMVGANKLAAATAAKTAPVVAAGATTAAVPVAATAAPVATTAAVPVAATAAPVAAGGGAMAGMAAIAAPVAIALGIGYLFSEIF